MRLSKPAPGNTVRAQDARGTTVYPASGSLSFTVGAASSNSYRQHGFIGVSPTDSRYFQFSDGSPFIPAGFNGGLDSAQQAEQKLQRYEQNKVNLVRVWMSGNSINGSQWTSWASHHLPNDSYLPGVSLDTQNTFNGSDVSMRLDNASPCLYADFWQGGVPSEPNTKYNVTTRIKVSGVTGPAAGGAYGFVVKQAGWLDKTCDQVNGTQITQPVNGTTGWITVTGSVITGTSQQWLSNLYLSRQNATGGSVYIDDVRVWKASDPAQVNLLREPNANSHLYFDSMSSASWDRYIQSAEQHGVYLKLVIDEKNEWIRDRIDAKGQMTGQPDNNNFYARAQHQGALAGAGLVALSGRPLGL